MTTVSTSNPGASAVASIKRPWLGFVITIIIALVFLYGMPLLPSLNIGNTYSTMVAALPNNLGARIEWALGDWVDAQFYKNWIGGLLLILGGFVAMALEKTNSKLKGFGITYGTGLFVNILIAEIIADVISNILYIPLFVHDPVAAKVGWIPTFIPVCSFAAGTVLIFGGDWKKVLTGGVVGGIVGCPGSWFIIKYICVPTGMPVAVGNVGIMVIGTFVIFEAYRYIPWMYPQKVGQETPPRSSPVTQTDPQPLKLAYDDCNQTWLFVRRCFADMNECCFFGSDVAAFIMVVGLIIGQLLNAKNPSYGTTWLGAVLSVQLMASAVGLFLYWHRFKELGWIGTFVPVVTLGPAAVLIYGPKLYVVLAAAIFGGVFGAPIARAIAAKLPSHIHTYVGVVASMLIITLIFIAVFQAMPWFGQPGL